MNQNLYKHGPGIANVIKEIKTIYQDLTKDNDFVPACHYTKREESLKAMFSERVPKNTYWY